MPKLVDTTASIPYKTLFFVNIYLNGQVLVILPILIFFQSVQLEAVAEKAEKAQFDPLFFGKAQRIQGSSFPFWSSQMLHKNA